MRTNINLLPKDLAGESDVARLKKILNRASMFLVASFLVAAALGGAYMLILSGQINASRQVQDKSIQEIESLRAVEEQYVLVRDRIGKAKSVLTLGSAAESSMVFRDLVSALPSEIIISEAEIGESSVKVTFQATSSRPLVGLFSALSQEGVFKRVLLKNFNFNKAVGYIASLELTI